MKHNSVLDVTGTTVPLTESEASSVSFLGLRLDRFTIDELTAVVRSVIQESRKCIFANHNMHSLYLVHHEPRVGVFYKTAHYVHADGMWVVFLAKMLGVPIKREHRVTYLDWIDALMNRASQEAWRVYYLGSKPGVAERGASVLRERYPNLDIRTSHGYFDVARESSANRSRLAAIQAFRPHVLLIGMGMPRQELWVLDNLSEIDANAILMSGAAMDYVAGEIRTPPRWTGQVGLEWLWRLWHEPKRLWRRYLVEPWFMMHIVAKAFWQTLQTRERGLGSATAPSRGNVEPVRSVHQETRLGEMES